MPEWGKIILLKEKAVKNHLGELDGLREKATK
jgi:hypothetical protein